MVESFGLYDELSRTGLPGATPVTRTPGVAYRLSGADTMVLQDRLGSGRVATDGAGLPKGAAHFGGYGVQIGRAGNGTGLLGFASGWGYERTDPGWDYLSQRYYDSATGRFLSRDPIRWAGGLNLYGYCGADPVNGVDPSGLFDLVPYVAPAGYQTAYPMSLVAAGGASAAASGGGGAAAAGAAAAAGPALVIGTIALGADGIIELIRYRPGRPSGPLTRMGDYLGNEIGSVSWPWSRRPPNPYGRRGSPAHRGMVLAAEQRLTDLGWTTVSGGSLGERAVPIPCGGIRYPDLVMVKNGVRIAIQVGRRQLDEQASQA